VETKSIDLTATLCLMNYKIYLVQIYATHMNNVYPGARLLDKFLYQKLIIGDTPKPIRSQKIATLCTLTHRLKHGS
jgi:hypothetical protein